MKKSIKRLILINSLAILSINPLLALIPISNMGVKGIKPIDFKPVEQIDWKTALFCAYASYSAYESDGIKFADFAKRWHFKKVQELKSDDMKSSANGYIYKKRVKIDGVSKELWLVAFRGTKRNGDNIDIKDLITDIALGDLSKSGGFHQGFLDAEKSFVKKVNMRELLKNSNKKIYLITGHSLGGAIANLFALDLSSRGIKKSQILVYTIGQPPVGTKKAVSIFSKSFNLHRIFFLDDPIPLVDNIVHAGLSFADGGYSIGLGGHSSEKYYIPRLKTLAREFLKSSVWNGNGSILDYKKDDTKGLNGFGFEKDVTIANFQDTPVKTFNSFQWQINQEDGDYLSIYTIPKTDLKYNICFGSWKSRAKDKYCYKSVKLPISINPYKLYPDGANINGAWITIGIEPTKIENKRAFSIYAKPVAELDENEVNSVGKRGKLIELDGTHFWSGTGSMISYKAKNKRGVGFTEDYAYLDLSPKGLKPALFFQWQVNNSIGNRVLLESNCATLATIKFGSWRRRDRDIEYRRVKLPFTLSSDLKLPNGAWEVIEVKVNETKKECPTLSYIKASVIK